MPVVNGELIHSFIHGFMYFGDVVFSVSGALAAGKRKMDVVGYVLIGVVTGLGGGTLRDLLLGRPVWWTRNSLELLLCIAATLCTYFWVFRSSNRYNATAWFDALGLSAFTVTGSGVAMQWGVPWEVAIFMGVMTATGGGVIRDVLTDTRPMILCGQLYAVAALVGAFINVGLVKISVLPEVAMAAGFVGTLLIRGATILYDIQLGPPGEFLRIGGRSAVIKKTGKINL